MSSMFNQCNSLKSIKFGKINTKNVIDMSNFFKGCNELESVDLNNLDTENVEDMSNMFNNCGKLNEIDISQFKTYKVQNMFGMFEKCSLTSLDLTHFDTQIVTNMANMFKDCSNLNALKLNFYTEKVENMNNMFSNCSSLTSIDIIMFNTTNCNNFVNIFESDSQLQLYIDSNKCRNLLEFIPDNINITNSPSKEIIGEMHCYYDVKTIENNTILIGEEFEINSEFDMYLDNKYIKNLREYKMNYLGKQEIQFMLYEDLNMDYMFKDVPDLISIEMKSEKNCQILSMKSSFENSQSLYEFNITGFSADKIKSMNKLFYKSNLKSFSFNSFDTKNLEDISYMFANTHIINFSLNGLNINNVKNMSHLFENCLSLVSLNNEGFETCKVIDVSSMFEKSSITNLDLSNFDTNMVINMKNMFNDCESLEILNLNFNTDNVENMENMFSSCLNLSSLNITTFNIDNCNSFKNMLENDEGLILYVDTFKCKKLVETIPDYVIIIDVVTIPSIGEINCIYDIQNSDKKTQILGKEFKFNIDYRLDIYINGKKIKFSKEYKVNNIGETNIKFKLYYDLNMDYMFKDVSDLISVEMISEKVVFPRF